MKVIYTKKSNSGVEECERQIAEFILEFRFMFLANCLPPISVVNDLFQHGPADWGGTNRISWEKFQINIEEYEILCQKLGSLNGYSLVEVPEEVDTAYKWYVWQNELKYGIPYEKHKALMDAEQDCARKMAAAGEKGDDELMLYYHLERARLADEIQCLFDEYIKQ